jgi:signal transduction histidine kinase
MQTGMRALFGLDVAGSTKDDTAAVRSRVLREQTGLLIAQSRTGMLMAIVAASLLGVPMVTYGGIWAFATWWLAMAAGYLLRQRLMERAQAHGSLEQVLRITVVGAALLGLLITLPGPLYFGVANDSARAFLTMFHLAWMAAAVTVLGVFPPSYKVYLICSMSNIMLGWWLSPASRTDTLLVSAALPPMWLVLAKFSDRVGRLIEESVNIRHERERLVQQLETALAETESAQRARSRFLASASHDLLQPVHALLLLSGLSRDLANSPRRDEVLRQLHTTAESIDSMFRGLLDLARHDAGTLQPQLASMPVAHVLRSVQAAYQARCAGKGVTLTVEAPPGVYVHADPALFDRIVRNLVDNAVKFTPAGNITVRCRAEGDEVAIAVEDSGVGIAAADLAHVQEAFYRGSSAREVEADGVGLGLANGTLMAELLHGRIALRSEHGKGTCVTLTLPAGVSPQDALPASNQRRALRYQRIVLVEDDRNVRLATELWLREQGAQVIAAASADSAVEQCLARGMSGDNAPQFLLCDYRLGASTAVQALRVLRDRFGPLPAAIVSGEDIDPATLPPGVPLLAKPLRPEKLLALLAG